MPDVSPAISHPRPGRVERDKLEEYIQRACEEPRQFIAEHPYPEAEQGLEQTNSDPDEAAAPAGMSNPRPPAAALKSAR
ncbi:hypothetical protein ABZS29_26365 [Kribbella sp. NPDC005582]|uniref:hypothetical protein n=1 Tax=Kribbella sp. NPDC005582 TaxID=3156893 RepID=UPI0033B9F70D